MTELAAVPTAELPPRYRLLHVLKETPGTSVYHVVDAVDDSEKALKVLRHGFTRAQDLLQFKSEFATLATIEHPNIVRVHEFGLLDDHHPYFTMEFFPGQRVNDAFNGTDWSWLYDVAMQIASGLHHIHHQKIVHLDIKPSNIMVDGSGRVKIMDFGVAAETSRVFDRRIRGTIQYMAPEVLQQDEIDGRTDLYALGMTLYETVTGALPTTGRAPIDVMRFHLHEDVRRPTALNPSIPPRLEKVIVRLLEKDPRRRYSSAAALFHDLADAAGVETPAAGLLAGSGELLAAPLVGRQNDLRILLDAVDGARRGEGGGVIVAGPEGIGKSRIVREATVRAQLDGSRVFWGRCPVNRKTIYAPFMDIFQQMVRAVNPEADASEEMRRLLRTSENDRADDKPLRGQKFRLYNRIVQSLQDFYGFLNVVGPSSSPLILVIEDLQFADASTAELFRFLVNDARNSSLVVLGTISTDASLSGEKAGIESAWRERAGEAGLRWLDLEPLDETMVSEYVGAIIGDQEVQHDLVRWMLWESKGSPVNIRRILDYLIRQRYLTSTADGWIADMEEIQKLRIPGGAGAFWSEKLAEIEPDHRALLEVLSVLGEHVELDDLTRLSEASPEDVWAAVCDLSAGGLLESDAERNVFSFPQMRLREALYNEIPTARRAALHAAAAAILEERWNDATPEVAGQLSYHYARSDTPERGIPFAVEAGKQATAALAHEQAAEFYRIALELMDLSGVDQEKPEIRERLGDAYYRSNNYRGAMQVFQFLLKSLQAKAEGARESRQSAELMKKIGRVHAKRREYAAALSYYSRAVAVYRDHDAIEQVAELLNRMAWLHQEKGDIDEAEKLASEAESLIEDRETGLVSGYVKNTLGGLAYARGAWETARRCYEEALAIARSVGSTSLTSDTVARLGHVLWKIGEWDEAADLFRQNLDSAEREGDLWDLVSAYNNVGIIEFSRGNFHTAEELFHRSVRLDEKLGTPSHEMRALRNHGVTLEMTGRWHEAMAQYRRCISMHAPEDHSFAWSVYVPLARLTSKMGDSVRALEYAQKAADAAARLRDDELAAEAAFALALIEEERENFEESQRQLDRAVALFEKRSSAFGIARARSLAADLLLRQHRVEQATEHAKEAETIARRLGDRFTLAQIEAIHGKLAFYGGDRNEAEARFGAALAAYQDLDTPYEKARLLFDLGLLRDDPEEASETIRNAIRIFERLEATSDLERARGALFRIRPAGKSASSNVIGLYEVVKVINSSLDLDEVLNRVLDLALRRLRGERGMLILLDPVTSALRTRIVRNIRESDEEQSKRSPQAVVKEVIQTGRSIISADARSDERFIQSETVISENIVSMICVPLVIRERIAGAIYVDHRETRQLFSQKDLNFLEAFADQAAIAIDNARLYEQLEEAKARLSLENETLRKEVLAEKHLDSIVGHSEQVARIQFTIRKAASSASTVLVRGESGTGKGLAARIIHNVSARRNGPFIKFNCAALPETLAESELFGHEKGAFTGADRRKLGRFELANGGTIFLDEIGKMTFAMQAKLLRVVEDKEFERVGGTQTIRTDVKIIAATNLNLEKAIQQGTFREDLFYRLNIIPLYLPPLRERKDDIPALTDYFLRKICRDLGIEQKRLEPGILELFASYDWPGNIRELEAVLHRAIVMTNDEYLRPVEFYSLLNDPHKTIMPTPIEVLPNDLLNPMVRRMDVNEELYDMVTTRVDRQLIVQALEASGGRIRETARRLGLARNTLKSKIQKYGIVLQDNESE